MSSESPTPSSPQETEPRPRDRHAMIVTICVLISIFFVVMVGVLYHYWRTKKVPTAVIAVVGRKIHDGTIVSVSVGAEREKREAQLGSANNYECQFFLSPQSAAVHVHLRHVDGTPYKSYEIPQLKEYERGVVVLPTALVVVHGAAGDEGAIVGIYDGAGPVAPPAPIDRQKHTYRAAIDPARGDYRLRVQRIDGTVRTMPIKTLADGEVIDLELSPGAATAPARPKTP